MCHSLLPPRRLDPLPPRRLDLIRCKLVGWTCFHTRVNRSRPSLEALSSSSECSEALEEPP